MTFKPIGPWAVPEPVNCPRCGMALSDPRHELLPDGCRAHIVYGGTE